MTDHYLRGSREVFSRLVGYEATLDIRNLDSLSAGRGCKYLLAIKGKAGEYIAKAWKRNIPDKILTTEYLISFNTQRDHS